MKRDTLYNLGLTIIIFIFNILLITSIEFIIKIPLTKLNVIISFVLALITYISILKKSKNTKNE